MLAWSLEDLLQATVKTKRRRPQRSLSCQNWAGSNVKKRELNEGEREQRRSSMRLEQICCTLFFDTIQCGPHRPKQVLRLFEKKIRCFPQSVCNVSSVEFMFIIEEGNGCKDVLTRVGLWWRLAGTGTWRVPGWGNGRKGSGSRLASGNVFGT